MKTKFEINDCDVVLDADQIWRFPEKNIGWNYAKLKVGSDGQFWDFGYSHFGGGGPAMPKVGKFKSREEAVEAGLAYMKNYFETRSEQGIGKPSEVKAAGENFLHFLANRNQLSLF